MLAIIVSFLQSNKMTGNKLYSKVIQKTQHGDVNQVTSIKTYVNNKCVGALTIHNDTRNSEAVTSTFIVSFL